MKRSLPYIALTLCLILVAWTLRPEKNKTDFDLASFSHLPTLVNGRVKPLDSVARNTLIVLQGRQRVTAADGRTISPTEWMLDAMLRPAIADEQKVFEIVNGEVLALFKLKPEDGAAKKRFSLNQLRSGFDELTRQARLASQSEGRARTVFQKAVLQLHSNLDLYQRLRFSIQFPDTNDLLTELQSFADRLPAGLQAIQDKDAGRSFDKAARDGILEDASKFQFLDETALIHPIPPADGAHADDWRTVGGSLRECFQGAQIPPDTWAYAGLARTWLSQDAKQFNEIVRVYREQLDKSQPGIMRKCDIEALFNRSQPFYVSALIYVISFLCAVFSWLFLPKELAKTAFFFICVAFVLSTTGIFARMWLEGRPPVTNLYSSALFVGWVAVTLCVFVEYFFKNSLGSMAAGIIGACTLVIAHYLSLGGDTMEMMRAVLDSNFWLATHVVTISIGYGASFLAGIYALIYISFGVFTRALDQKTANTLTGIVYGVVCFATFFSLVGTVLGGIWADQSWGRFWGWDPKENGALIIVIWNAIILHARWGGLVRQKGIMALAVFGNIVTAWSWFGTNMLGVGLHSYGFNDRGAVVLTLFMLSQVFFIVVACLPPQFWRSKALKA